MAPVYGMNGRVNLGSHRSVGWVRKELRLDEPTIRMFLATEYPKLVAAVGLIAGSRAAGEDAVQEALARAWERSERGERIESLGAWVTTAATNLARSRWRRLRAERRARERIVSMAAGAPGTAEGPGRSAELAMDLRRALDGLPKRQREATVLHYYLGHDVAAVARLLGVSDGTIKTSLHRARRALGEALGEKENDVVGA